MPKKIAVIGAGIIGLTSAIRLQEQGYQVTIFAKDVLDNIASRAAPAFWIPFKAFPEDLIIKWAKIGLDVYKQLPPGLGVELMEYEEVHPHKTTLPLWAKVTNDYRETLATELQAPYTSGYTSNLYRIDTSIYVDKLLTEYKNNHGIIHEVMLNKITDIDPSFSLIINCSGIGSNVLVPDDETFPIRGQYVLVERPKGLNKISFAPQDDDNYILVVPRTHDCYLGGTTYDGDWNTEINPFITDNIILRTQTLVPALKGAKVLKVGVGLRPGRRTVRLETELLPDNRTVIHNYGHGGAGFTIGWGCAQEVADLVSKL